MGKVKVTKVVSDSCGDPVIVDAGEVDACPLCESRIGREHMLTRCLQQRAVDAREMCTLRARHDRAVELLKTWKTLYLNPGCEIDSVGLFKDTREWLAEDGEE